MLLGYCRMFSERNLNLKTNHLLSSQFFARSLCCISSIAATSQLPVLHFCPSCWTGTFPVQRNLAWVR